MEPAFTRSPKALRPFDPGSNRVHSLAYWSFDGHILEVFALALLRISLSIYSRPGQPLPPSTARTGSV